jgi:hypothetical protein
MKKTVLTFILTLLFGWGLSLFPKVSNPLFAQTDSLNSKILTVKQMQEDFQFLRRALQETHPGLYRYTPKPEMQAKMDSIASLLNKEMRFYDFYKLITFLIAEVRCAHTFALPIKNFEPYYLNTMKTFPFSIQLINERFYIVLNGTLDMKSDTKVNLGDELLSINGVPMKEIKKHIFRYLWTDGYIETSKNHTLTEIYFPLFYYFMFAQPDTFDLELKNSKNEVFHTQVLAQTWKETSANFIKNPINQPVIKAYKPKNKKDRKKGWRLEFLDEPKTAYLRITGFGGGKNETEARQKMTDFLNRCMKKLKSKNTENLILDLRYNGGGWDIQGVELLTFLAKTPFRSYQSLHAITDSSEFFKFGDFSAEDLAKSRKEVKKESDGTFSVQEAFSPQLQVQQPKNNRFTGDIYIITNGRSGSTTAEFTAAAHANKVGVFVGEETGGAYEGGNGGSFLHFELPHSKIHIGTPLLYYRNAVSEPKYKGRGTLPDYEVPNKIENMLQGIDTQLEFALELIRKKRRK